MNVYCNICNPFQYQTKFMTDPTLRTQVNKDLTDFEDGHAQRQRCRRCPS